MSDKVTRLRVDFRAFDNQGKTIRTFARTGFVDVHLESNHSGELCIWTKDHVTQLAPMCLAAMRIMKDTNVKHAKEVKWVWLVADRPKDAPTADYIFDRVSISVDTL